MSECCGKKVKSKFCPDCGSAISASPAEALLRHCRKVAAATAKTADNIAERAKDPQINEEWRARRMKRAENHRRRADVWKSWADDLAKLLEESRNA